MPSLSVIKAVTNLRFQDKFTVYRRVETVTNQGLSTTVSTAIPNIYGVVTQEPGNALTQGADSEYQEDIIGIISRFQFQGPTDLNPETKPDQILLADGNTYEVTNIQAFSRFGPGFCEITAGSIANLDKPG